MICSFPFSSLKLKLKAYKYNLSPDYIEPYCPDIAAMIILLNTLQNLNSSRTILKRDGLWGELPTSTPHRTVQPEIYPYAAKIPPYQKINKRLSLAPTTKGKSEPTANHISRANVLKPVPILGMSTLISVTLYIMQWVPEFVQVSKRIILWT